MSRLTNIGIAAFMTNRAGKNNRIIRIISKNISFCMSWLMGLREVRSSAVEPRTARSANSLACRVRRHKSGSIYFYLFINSGPRFDCTIYCNSCFYNLSKQFMLTRWFQITELQNCWSNLEHKAWFVSMVQIYLVLDLK